MLDRVDERKGVAASSAELAEQGRSARTMATSIDAGRELQPNVGRERSGAVLPVRWRAAAIRQGRRIFTLGRLSFLFVVVLPTVAAAVFCLAIASPRYTSEFRVAVRSLQQQKMGGIGEIMGFAGMTGSGNDAHAVVQYLESRQAISDLGGPEFVSKLFDSSSVDFFSRLEPSTQIEKLTRYWNYMVDPVYEVTTSTIIVRVTTFNPDDSKLVATRLLGNAEALVNKMSERSHHDSVDFAEREVAEAQARLDVIREKIRIWQDREAILDPLKSAETTLTIAAKLKDQIAKLAAQLMTQQTRLSDNAPSVVSTRNQIDGLQRELARVESEATAAQMRTSDQPSDRPLTSVLGAFQQLVDDKSFAEKAYLNALLSLETAKMDAAKQQVYLATIVPPGLPEEPSFPKPLRQILITFGVALSLWIIGLLGVHAIREHA